ncbi:MULTISPECIES: VOC family protein [unclassified Oceanispirochaeta]|uniref:VOC family protein n=1 Tax=unclassified Oceanispirochaeta TaxID=2635722 RepID=UPI000E09B152|nr:MULTISPECIES: VOC family protein [unclassified Oceanispirochaeta]MBF9016319.1 VOC family protein [Oceanispirochaeta sp. M2]NPD72782.1 glyoxalase/bleomycin resistance/dioxygenase family protein [Oceanispirochaeta sp. M1]RDG31627.1 glyoxalase/bleomycin resistance/dioxygenase family protein [Oceanispirochaeta sp. M1]
MKYMAVLIVVDDIQKSRYFYETILEQKLKMDFGENITFHGDFSIHLKEHFQGIIQGAVNQGRHNNCELYFEHDELENLHTVLQDEGIQFLHSIMEQPWRQKVMRFYDYDGNLIEVGESMDHVAYRLSQEGLEIPEISKTTYLSIPMVKEAIEKYS